MNTWQIIAVVWIAVAIPLSVGFGCLARRSMTSEELERERADYENFKAHLETARQNRAAASNSPEEVRMLLGTWDRGKDRRKTHIVCWGDNERRNHEERRRA